MTIHPRCHCPRMCHQYKCHLHCLRPLRQTWLLAPERRSRACHACASSLSSHRTTRACAASGARRSTRAVATSRARAFRAPTLSAVAVATRAGVTASAMVRQGLSKGDRGREATQAAQKAVGASPLFRRDPQILELYFGRLLCPWPETLPTARPSVAMRLKRRG